MDNKVFLMLWQFLFAELVFFYIIGLRRKNKRPMSKKFSFEINKIAKFDIRLNLSELL